MGAIVRFDQRQFDTWGNALEDFLCSLRAKGYAPRTVSDYALHVKMLFARFPDSRGSGLKSAAHRHMAQEGLAPASFNIRRKYLRGFFAWCVEEGILDKSPLDGIKARRTEPRIVRLEQETLAALLKIPDTSTYCGLRDRALLLVSLDSGIRPQEALSLLVPDVDHVQGVITIRAAVAKTRRGRTLFLSSVTCDALRALLRVRPKEWKAAPVFCTDTGKPFSVDAWGKRLRRLTLPRLGVAISPYDLRHAHALEFIRAGGNLMALKEEMGHTDISTTQGYLAVTAKDIRDAHASASPLLAICPQQTRLRKIEGKKPK